MLLSFRKTEKRKTNVLQLLMIIFHNTILVTYRMPLVLSDYFFKVSTTTLIWLLLFLVLVPALAQTTQTTTTTKQYPIFNPTTSSSASILICHVRQYEIIVDENIRQPFYTCSTVKNATNNNHFLEEYQYNIDLTDELIKEHNDRLRNDQSTFLSIPGGTINQHTSSIDIPDISLVTFINKPNTLDRRKLFLPNLRWWTDKEPLSVLPVLIHTSGDDQGPNINPDELYDFLFNYYNSLAKQFDRCSFGKIILEPTSIGILNVTIDANATADLPHTYFVNMATPIALELVNDYSSELNTTTPTYTNILEYADIVMFITPPVEGWVAFANVGGQTSVYNGMWGMYLGIQMHEIGHNFLLQHANAEQAYGDNTGYMGGAIIGYHDLKMGYPKMCYNSYNNWILGWYNDRTITIAPTVTPQIVRIAAFVDYSKTSSNEYVIGKIGNNLYMQFNRAKTFNVDTYEYKNNLVIIEKLNDEEDTRLVIGLNGLDTPKYEGNYTMTIGSDDSNNTTTLPITFEICGWGVGNEYEPDFLDVSIGLGTSVCDNSRRLDESYFNIDSSKHEVVSDDVNLPTTKWYFNPSPTKGTTRTKHVKIRRQQDFR